MIHQWLSGLAKWTEAWPNSAALLWSFGKSGIILGLAAIVVFSWRNHSACVRNWTWRCAFCGLIALSVWQWVPRSMQEKVPAFHMQQVSYVPLPSPRAELVPSASSSAQLPVAQAPVEELNPSAQKTTSIPTIGIVAPLLQLLESTLFWMVAIGACALIVLYSIRVISGRYWLSRTRTLCEVETQERGLRLAKTLGVSSVPEIYQSDAISTPILVGWLRPQICLPKTYILWSERKLNSVLLHELAHWHRGDGWWQTVATLTTALWWWNPLVWLALRRLKSEAEEAADDIVVLQQGEPYLYAQSLVEIAAEPVVAIPEALAIPILGELPLEQRVRRILKESFQRGKIGAWGAGILALLVVVMAICIGCNVTTNKENKLDPRNTGHVSIQIFDENSKPVSGAIVDSFTLAFARQLNDESTVLWNENTPGVNPNSEPSDANGRVDMAYPKILNNGMPTSSMFCYMWHPDYVVGEVCVYVNGLPQVPARLVHGTAVTVEVEPIPHVSLDEIYVQSFDQIIKPVFWNRISETKVLAHMPGNQYPFRVVGKDRKGRLYFSETQMQSVPKEGSVNLKFVLRPGRELKGSLDTSVPRPIKNGVVHICVTSGEEKVLNAKNNWLASAPISNDGHFMFSGLPEGTAFAVAFCDGYVSQDAMKGIEINSGIVPMQSTGQVRIAVKDKDGNPARGVWVRCGLDAKLGETRCPLGMFTDMLEVLRLWTRPSGKGMLFLGMDRYSKKTDDQGTVLMDNIPTGSVQFWAGDDQHESLGRGTATVSVSVKAVAMADITLHQKSVTAAQEPNSTSTPSSSPISTKKVIIQVVDQDGKPILGAKIEPLSLQTREQPDSSYILGLSQKSHSYFSATESDAEGRAEMTYPVLWEGFHTATVSVQLTHSDYLSNNDVAFDVSSPKPLVMDRGGILTVHYDSIPSVNLGPVYMDVGRILHNMRNVSSPIRIRSRGMAISRSADGVGSQLCLPGDYHESVRAMATDGKGHFYFSEIKSVHVPIGQAGELQLPLSPGREITGQVEESVPRPIKNGHIVACIETPGPYPEMKHFWFLTTEIGADGRFRLSEIPEGQISLHALCDGFISRQSETVSGVGLRLPQTFPLEAQSSLLVRMEPTGTASVVVRNEAGQPLPGIIVSLGIWMELNEWSGPIDEAENSRDRFTETPVDARESWDRAFSTPAKLGRYQAMTDADGVAVVPNLPSGRWNYSVKNPRAPFLSSPRTGRRIKPFLNDQMIIEIQPGKVATAKASM